MSDRSRRPWTYEEDTLLTSLVENNPNVVWTKIAENFDNRTGKQCRERWVNHLNPEINETTWSQAEDTLLYKMHQIIGNKWATIARSLPGRTENAVKNRWYTNIMKRVMKDSFARNSLTEEPSKGSTVIHEFKQREFMSVPLRPIPEFLFDSITEPILSTAPAYSQTTRRKVSEFSVPLQFQRKEGTLADQSLMTPDFSSAPSNSACIITPPIIPKKKVFTEDSLSVAKLMNQHDEKPPPCMIRVMGKPKPRQ